MSYDNCFFNADGKLVCGYSDCNWQPWSGISPVPDYTVKCEQANKNYNPPQTFYPNPIPYYRKMPNQNTVGRYVQCQENFSNICGVRDDNFGPYDMRPAYTVSDLLKADGQGLVYLN